MPLSMLINSGFINKYHNSADGQVYLQIYLTRMATTRMDANSSL